MMLLLSSKRVFPTGNHERVLETHIRKAKAAGTTDEEITHTLLLLISTTGFPIFMKAYSVLKSVRRV